MLRVYSQDYKDIENYKRYLRYMRTKSFGWKLWRTIELTEDRLVANRSNPRFPVTTQTLIQ